MTVTFFVIWAVILVFVTVLLGALTWVQQSPRFAHARIQPPGQNRISPARKFINTNLNNMMALSIFLAFLYHLGPSVLEPGWPGFTRLLGETLGVLLIYDLGYYGFHRTLHHPRLMRYVHSVHHKVRFPSSAESNFLHPLEQIGALSLLLGTMVLLGPISAMSFLLIFFIYSTVNIIIHSNLVFGHPALRLFNFWSISHDIHHRQFKHNYASIFPFWDQAFGTSRMGR